MRPRHPNAACRTPYSASWPNFDTLTVSRKRGESLGRQTIVLVLNCTMWFYYLSPTTCLKFRHHIFDQPRYVFLVHPKNCWVSTTRTLRNCVALNSSGMLTRCITPVHTPRFRFLPFSRGGAVSAAILSKTCIGSLTSATADVSVVSSVRLVSMMSRHRLRMVSMGRVVRR